MDWERRVNGGGDYNLASSSSGGDGCSMAGGFSYIQHPVSKFDTLAGVAIRYGVEVADIKRINGLVSDLQMFALKTLDIPLPGRHPPSPAISNGQDTQRFYLMDPVKTKLNRQNICCSDPPNGCRTCVGSPKNELTFGGSTQSTTFSFWRI